jgi:hypothetical protein
MEEDRVLFPLALLQAERRNVLSGMIRKSKSKYRALIRTYPIIDNGMSLGRGIMTDRLGGPRSLDWRMVHLIRLSKLSVVARRTIVGQCASVRHRYATPISFTSGANIMSKFAFITWTRPLLPPSLSSTGSKFSVSIS